MEQTTLTLNDIQECQIKVATEMGRLYSNEYNQQIYEAIIDCTKKSNIFDDKDIFVGYLYFAVKEKLMENENKIN